MLLKAFNTTLLIKICLRSIQLAFFYAEKFDKLIINDSLNSKNVLHYFEEQEIAWKDDDSTFFSKTNMSGNFCIFFIKLFLPLSLIYILSHCLMRVL